MAKVNIILALPVLHLLLCYKGTTASTNTTNTTTNACPTASYPYDPYEPFDPYDPYPFYFCELNDDEYGRPYYGPYDQYLRRTPPSTYPSEPPPTSYPTPPPPVYPTDPPTDPPPYTDPATTLPPFTIPVDYPTAAYPGSSYPYPRPTTELPPIEDYVQTINNLRRRKKRQTLSYPSCVTTNADECSQTAQNCTGYGTQYDSCNRRCTCRNGRLEDCCRVRKEWHSLTQLERCKYVQVVYTASTSSPWKGCYDDLIKAHRDHFGSGIHNQNFFLPWHRWYILALENLLRQIDCNITIPYWDWSMESQTWQNSIVWAEECGLGGNGDPVSTGLFRSTNSWYLTPSAGTNIPLSRSFRGTVPDCATVALNQRLGISEFDTWHSFVSSNLHDSVHCNINGVMCTIDAANSPEFFLHHAFIDQIWSSWQGRGPAFKNLPFYSQNTAVMPGTSYSPQELYDLNNQPGCVRVCVEPPSRPCRTNTSYTPLCPREMNCFDYSPLKLAEIIPRPYPSIPTESYTLFNTSLTQQNLANRHAQLMNSYEDLYAVLQNNGYQTRTSSYRPAYGEVQFNRYLYQPSPYTYAVAPNGTTYPPPPAECEPYLH